MKAPPHIAIRGLSHSYRPGEGRGPAVLDGVGLSVAAGEFVSIIGPSGCGKTTLLKSVGGVITPSAGKITIAGKPPREAQRGKQIGFVFQDPCLLPWRTVRDNIALPLHVNRAGRSEDASAAVERMIDAVGLSAFRSFYPHELSGGMKQRVALARAVVFRPAVLLMDEPLGALDELTRAAMRYEVLRVWEASPTTALMVTHSIAEAVSMSDRVIVLSPSPGRILDDIPVDLPRPRDDSLEHSAQFMAVVRRVKDSLSAGVAYAAARG